LHLLHTKIDSLKQDVPIPNEDACRRTCDSLEETCDIFLAKEEVYCREHNARPWVLEASIGLDEEPRRELDCREPITLSLSDGRLIRVGGRLDRIDKLLFGGSQRYAIWDYKSGSSYGFDQQNPLNQGRKLQPFLYVGMLRHRAAAIGDGKDTVQSCGYFFPSPKTDGLRLQWTWAELRSGDDVLRIICDLIAGGVFVATTDPQDCTYCDYLSVCGDAEVVSAESLRKSVQPCNHVLEPWRQLREISVEVQP
jgi:ATP-dependent helicase/nuclease subunit B